MGLDKENDVIDQIMISYTRALSEHIKRYIGKYYCRSEKFPDEPTKLPAEPEDNSNNKDPQ